MIYIDILFHWGYKLVNLYDKGTHLGSGKDAQQSEHDTMKRLPVSCLEDHRTLLWISTLKLVNEVNVIKKTQNNTKTNVFLREKNKDHFSHGRNLATAFRWISPRWRSWKIGWKDLTRWVNSSGIRTDFSGLKTHSRYGKSHIYRWFTDMYWLFSWFSYIHYISIYVLLNIEIFHGFV